MTTTTRINAIATGPAVSVHGANGHATFDGTMITVHRYPFAHRVIPLRNVAEIRSSFGRLVIYANDGRRFVVNHAYGHASKTRFAATIAEASSRLGA
jgi:hypothetical protein